MNGLRPKQEKYSVHENNLLLVIKLYSTIFSSKKYMCDFRRMGLTSSLLEVVPSFLYVRIINLYTKKDGATPNKDDANLIHLSSFTTYFYFFPKNTPRTEISF